ncbi:lantibiotic dehydratase [Streptomyces sp. NPDC002644]
MSVFFTGIKTAEIGEWLYGPSTCEIGRVRLLAELLRLRLLRSSLRAPATVTDPAEALPAALRARVRELPTAVDLRLDAAVRLPQAVLAEAGSAATVLSRLAPHPNGPPAWRRWIERFDGHQSPVPSLVPANPALPSTDVRGLWRPVTTPPPRPVESATTSRRMHPVRLAHRATTPRRSS